MKMKKIFSLISIAFLVLSMSWLVALNATVSASSTALDPDAPIRELTWALGDPYPVVNGHVIFPTSPAYKNHWWVGGVYPSSSPTQNARTAYMSIRVPDSGPKSDEVYYVLLSAWDSAGSYDQLGFSSYYGAWGLCYSWTTGPPDNLVYHYTPYAMALSWGVTYTFYITTDNGVTNFVAKQGSVQVWSVDAPTGGNHLVLNNTYSGKWDYTVYEEIWETSALGGSPDFDFYFFDNYWVSINGVTNSATWTSIASTEPGSSLPPNIDVEISGNSVFVDNPSATILFQTNPSTGTITFGMGGVGSTYSNGQSAHSLVDSDPLSMFPYSATANAPSGYGFDHWEYSGSSDRGVYVPDISSNPTEIIVNGDGWLKAVFSLIVHDIAVTDVRSSPTTVIVGDPVSIEVDVLNEGTEEETFDVNVYYDTTLIGTATVVLSAGTSTTLTFLWDTTGVPPGTYTIKAEVPPVPGEVDVDDNEFIDGTVTLVVHDIAVTDVRSSPTTVIVGDPVSIEVDVLNEGTEEETFDVNVYYDTTLIGTVSVTLSAGASTTLTFVWDTTGVSPGTYTIKAEVPPVPGEVDVDDNEFIDGTVTIAFPAYVDIKPGSWPNPLNLKSKGVLPVAICGTADFDVTTIDPETVRLSLQVGGIGVPPLRWAYRDVATPYTGAPYSGHDLDGDGYLDLSLKFNVQEVIQTLGLTSFSDRDVVTLILSGNLKQEYGGLLFLGQDYIVILKR